MSEILTSLVNPKVKRLIRLRDKRARVREDVILVEGRPEIDRFLETSGQVMECYYCPDLIEDKGILDQFKSDVKKYEVSDSVFNKLAYGHRLEGIILVCQTPQGTLAEIDAAQLSLCVLIEHVEKPGNLGAILRSCDGAGVDAVFVCDPHVDIYNPNVIRASLGTIFSRKVIALSNEEAGAFLEKHNVAVLAATPENAKDYTDVDLKQNVCIAVGAEDKGLSDYWLTRAVEKIAIPMRGAADSLNVSVSTGVILYEAIRQRS